MDHARNGRLRYDNITVFKHDKILLIIMMVKTMTMVVVDQLYAKLFYHACFMNYSKVYNFREPYNTFKVHNN